MQSVWGKGSHEVLQEIVSGERLQGCTCQVSYLLVINRKGSFLKGKEVDIIVCGKSFILSYSVPVTMYFFIYFKYSFILVSLILKCWQWPVLLQKCLSLLKENMVILDKSFRCIQWDHKVQPIISESLTTWKAGLSKNVVKDINSPTW